MSEYTFEPFQKVLVRDENDDRWGAEFFSHNRDNREYPYRCIGRNWKKCIPYEGNEHLLGKTDSPNPKWQPKPGELVAVSDDKKEWFAQVFISERLGREEGAYESSDTHDSSQPAYWQYCEPLRKHFNVPEEA